MEQQRSLLTAQLEKLDNETSLLHKSVDKCVDTILAACKTQQGKQHATQIWCPNISQILEKTISLMAQKCSQICSARQQHQSKFVDVGECSGIIEQNQAAIGTLQIKTTVSKMTAGRNRHTKPQMTTTSETSDARSRSFKCDICEKEFKSKASQSAHARYHTYELAYKCGDCGRGFPIQSQLERHRQKHTGEKRFKCEICNKSFHANSVLQQHRLTHGKDQPVYACTQCDRIYTRKRSLVLHQWMHRDDNPYKCHVCSQAFTSWNAVYEHIKVHTGEKPFKCDVCGKTFVRKTHLRKHMEIHAEIKVKPYQCAECQKAFVSANALNVHMVTHCSDTPYLCDLCGKSFKYKVSLRQHTNLHLSDRPAFTCDICHKTYKTENYLKSHRRIHLLNKMYKCDVCGKSFREKLQLTYHKWVHKTDKPHQCNICGKGFVLKSQLKKHSDIHRSDRPHKCELCEKNFKSKYEVNIHKKKVHIRKQIAAQTDTKPADQGKYNEDSITTKLSETCHSVSYSGAPNSAGVLQLESNPQYTPSHHVVESGQSILWTL